jgi:hypothetical protein
VIDAARGFPAAATPGLLAGVVVGEATFLHSDCSRRGQQRHLLLARRQDRGMIRQTPWFRRGERV